MYPIHTDDEKSKLTSFWMDDATKRDAWCNRCTCYNHCRVYRFFSNVCCGFGSRIDLASPNDGLTFCNMQISLPGIDAAYEDFIIYIDALPLEALISSSNSCPRQPKVSKSARNTVQSVTSVDSFRTMRVFKMLNIFASYWKIRAPEHNMFVAIKTITTTKKERSPDGSRDGPPKPDTSWIMPGC
jgi:hypothetical protein